MRDMLSVILRLILGIVAFFVIIIVVVFNYETGEDKRNIRLEEDRIAEYTAQNYKDVKKIEFKRFEKNISTQTWFIDAVKMRILEYRIILINLKKELKMNRILQKKEMLK